MEPIARIAEALAPVLGMATLGGVVLIGMRMRMEARLRGRSRPDAHESDRLAAAVERLDARLDSVAAEIHELHERVDFAERLLSQSSSASTEKHSTPV